MQEGFAFSHCTECRAMFILRANVPPERWWLRLKFQFLVARDHAFIFVIVQLVRTFNYVTLFILYYLSCFIGPYRDLCYMDSAITCDNMDTYLSVINANILKTLPLFPKM